MNTYAFIFARGGSKGIKDKNIKNFCGKPLIAWSIEMIKSLNSIKKLIVSTDSKKIASIAKSYGAEVPFIRPKYLAKDNSSEWMAWRHALKFIKKKEGILPDAMLSVPTTAPLRRIEDLKKCIALYYKKKPDAVITITEARRNPWFNMVAKDKNNNFHLVNKSNNKIFNRQQANNVYDMTTVAYVMKPEFVLKKDSIFCGTVKSIEIPASRSIDIDSQFDFNLAEILFKEKLNDKQPF